jgi:hypothetical protein
MSQRRAGRSSTSAGDVRAERRQRLGVASEEAPVPEDLLPATVGFHPMVTQAIARYYAVITFEGCRGSAHVRGACDPAEE